MRGSSRRPSPPPPRPRCRDTGWSSPSTISTIAPASKARCATPACAKVSGSSRTSALASGLLSGKYRATADLAKSPRGKGVEKYLDARGLRILAALDGVALARSAKPAEVALAWVMRQPGVTAPIASATSREQLDSLVRATQLTLSDADLQALSRA